MSEDSMNKLFREAVIDELVVAHIYTKEHDGDPRKAIKDAIDWNVEVALDWRVSNSAAAVRIRELEFQLEKSKKLITKHGICEECGELFEHDYDSPLAFCKCGTAEWYNLTPHMTAVSKAYTGVQQALLAEKDFWRERYNEIRSACEQEFHGHAPGITKTNCKICDILSQIEAMNF